MSLYTKMSLFDLDNTLLKGNSSYHFGKYLYREGILSPWQAPNMLLSYGLHKTHLLSLQSLHERIFSSFFKALPLSFITPHVKVFLELHLHNFLYEPAYTLLQQAQKEGAYVAILSNSPDFLVSAIGKALGVCCSMGTKYAVDENGCFSHVSSLLDGDAKSLWMEEMRAILNIDRSLVTAYSDSILDLPFLSSAGVAVAANPDKQLRALCQSRGWQII